MTDPDVFAPTADKSLTPQDMVAYEVAAYGDPGNERPGGVE